MKLVCRPTPVVRFNHMSELCSHQLMYRLARCWNPAKRDSVEHVHKNCSSILKLGTKNGSSFSPASRLSSPRLEKQWPSGASRVICITKEQVRRGESPL